MAAAFTQAELRERGAAKFRRADRMLFTRAGLEQASGEALAQHRAVRLAGGPRPLVDLCCGIGGDTAALHADLAVDLDPVHALLTRHNAAVYGVTTQAVVADVRDLRLTGTVAFADPARRDATGRGGYRPPLPWCLSVAACIKAAPGLALEAVPEGWEVEFVADGRDLKEAVLWAPAYATARTRATVLPGGDTLVAEPGADVPLDDPGTYLLDPNPAVTRAGLVQDLARRLGARQLDRRIAFLTTDRPVDSPFARCLQVIASQPWRPKDLQATLAGLDVGAVDIRRRGLAGDVEEIRRRLRLRGSRRVTLVMTRLQDQPWALVCLPVEQPGTGPTDP